MVQHLKEEKLVELQSFRPIFFVCGVLFLGASALAIYDEAIDRRPWKRVQEGFRQLETARAAEALTRAEKRLRAEPLRSKIAAAQRELARESARLESPSGKARTAREALQREEAALEQSRQAVIFARSERDAAYYAYKQAWAAGQPWSESKQVYDARDRVVHEAEGRAAKQESQVAAARRRLHGLESRRARLERWLQEQQREVEQAKRQLAAARERGLEIKQVNVPALGVADRCPTCHLAIDRPGFENLPQPYRTHPQLRSLIQKAHPVERFGCTPCHHGQGWQTKGVSRRPFDHGRDDHYWGRPLLRDGFLQATCRPCHAEEPQLAQAPLLGEGRRLFEAYQCGGCHEAPGFSGNVDRGPPLDKVRSKLRLGWLTRWIADPRTMRPATRMPSFWPDAVGARQGSAAWRRREREVVRIVAYLTSDIGARADAPATQSAVEPDPELGKRVVEEYGCRGCHLLGGERRLRPEAVHYYRSFAPELDDLGKKTTEAWVARWLTAPRSYWAKTRMPDLRLTASEAASAARYLLGRSEAGARETERPPLELERALAGGRLAALAAEGKKLIGTYGCFGCHEVKGFERAARIGGSLGDFGDKPVERLDFGNLQVARPQRTWLEWVKRKLRAPRSFATERIPLRMPAYVFTQKEITALAVLLRSFVEEQPPASHVLRPAAGEREMIRGEQLVERFGCRGCHVLGKRGGFIRGYYPKSAVALAPPPLDGEGRKVVPNWLFGFLGQSIKLRPWLKVRMPTFTFTPAEQEALVRYFMSMDKVKDILYAPPKGISAADRTVAQGAFERLKCIKCHSLQTAAPAKLLAGKERTKLEIADLAPDLALTKTRLRYEWVIDWLKNPQALQYGTKMPTYFPLADEDDPTSFSTPLRDVLEGNALAQIKLLADYLYNLE